MFLINSLLFKVGKYYLNSLLFQSFRYYMWFESSLSVDMLQIEDFKCKTTGIKLRLFLFLCTEFTFQPTPTYSEAI